MKTLIGSRIRIITGVAFLVCILGILNSCSKSAMDNMYGMGGNTGNKGTPGTNEVWIQGMAFTPSTITVNEGTTITWTNKESTAHTVTSDDNLFDSQSLGIGKTFAFTFPTAGTYSYHCSIHPAMTGKVIVKSGSTASALISIYNMAFSPATITVKAGTIVTWTNYDSAIHSVTSDSNLFDSGALDSPGLYTSGGSFSQTFTTVGTYLYHCKYHPGMNGQIIVN